MPRKRRIAKRRSGTRLPRLRALLADGEPWRGPVSGVSESGLLTDLLTGHDFFGDGFRGDREAMAAMWEVLRREAMDAFDRHAPAGAREPWALLHLDRKVKVEPQRIVTLAGVRYWFDEHAADRVVTFFRSYIRHIEGRTPGELFDPLPWQEEWLRELYGWKRPDGLRRYRDAYLEVAKKNGKSFKVSGCCLYHLLADGEVRPKVFGLAADRTQARIVYNAAKSIVEADPRLSSVCEVFRHRMEGRITQGEYQVMSAEAYTKHGVNAAAWVFDELHAQPTRDLWDVLDGAGTARAQPMRISITTAGWDRNSICWERREEARETLKDPAYNPRLYPKIFTMMKEGPKGEETPPTREEWSKLETWRPANPSMGAAFEEEKITDLIAEALRNPARENVILRLHGNVWTRLEVRLIPFPDWDECGGDFDPAAYPCVGSAIDLAHTNDISAWLRLYDLGEDVLGLVGTYWIPEADIELRTQRDKVPYQLWAQRGLVNVTPGDVTDFDRIRDHIEAQTDSRWRTGSEKCPFWIAYDRRFATQLVTQLTGRGYRMIPYGQSFNDMAAPTQELIRRTLSRQIAHRGDPVLRWMATNAAGEQSPEGHVRVVKAKSTERVDGIVASVMALGWWMRQPKAGPSRYEDPDSELLLI